MLRILSSFILLALLTNNAFAFVGGKVLHGAWKDYNGVAIVAYYPGQTAIIEQHLIKLGCTIKVRNAKSHFFVVNVPSQTKLVSLSKVKGVKFIEPNYRSSNLDGRPLVVFGYWHEYIAANRLAVVNCNQQQINVVIRKCQQFGFKVQKHSKTSIVVVLPRWNSLSTLARIQGVVSIEPHK